MKSNYKRIGDCIRLVDERNTNLQVKKLLGLSISKEFIPSVANIIGTDMKNYKIIRRNQFACSTMQVRRDRKMPVALLTNIDEAIISAAYPVFEVADTEFILPEYLMMWFRRSEFDREACFYAIGGVRGSIEWEDFCNMQVPVPSITKQKEIVKEYNVLVDRINLNNRLIQKLEETAQAIYKQWFVDFDFPDENGMPYKSSGGEMKFNMESDKEIPKGWKTTKIGTLCECNSLTLSSKDIFETIAYLDTSSITNNEIEEIQILNLKVDEIPSRAKRKVIHNDIIFSTVRPILKHFGILKNTNENMVVSTGFAVLHPTYSNLCSELLYLTITKEENLQNLQAKAEMSVSTYPSIKPEDLLNLDYILPPNEILEKADSIFVSIFNFLGNLQMEKKMAKSFTDIILSKLATVGDNL
jgi:type I restriction enzyme S subunit